MKSNKDDILKLLIKEMLYILQQEKVNEGEIRRVRNLADCYDRIYFAYVK